MTAKEVSEFEKVQAQLEGFYKEVSILSRKSPNDAVNKFKLKYINLILMDANKLLVHDYKPLLGFETFDNEELPSNSDAAMIFEQYLSCMEKLRSDNVQFKSIAWYWIIDGKPSEIRTSKPLKYKDK